MNSGALAAELEGEAGVRPLIVSGATGAGVEAVLDALIERLAPEREAAGETEPGWSPL